MLWHAKPKDISHQLCQKIVHYRYFTDIKWNLDFLRFISKLIGTESMKVDMYMKLGKLFTVIGMKEKPI